MISVTSVYILTTAAEGGYQLYKLLNDYYFLHFLGCVTASYYYWVWAIKDP